MSIRNTFVIIIFVISAVISGLSVLHAKEKAGDLFNYGKILDDEYRIKTGAVIPLTISKAIETDGSVTSDGNYFFFSSDAEGNFDIYLRSLTDITTVRITGHSSRDTSPAFSPSGKYLAFVSRRDDPEGDIFILKIKPEKLIADAKEKSPVSGMDDKAKNITSAADSYERNAIIKDASPCWSPDGRRIAFSSTRGMTNSNITENSGTENIWIMDSDGGNLTRVTEKGGVYPRFSNDGRKIIFISYRDNESGDIYLADIINHTETRITNSPDIKLHPSFTGKDSEVIYTLIDRDTDGDKNITLKDNSVIGYKNLNNELEYRLTLYSESSFQPVWSPVYNGVMIYSNQSGENINVNIIPEYGIIPKKQNPRLQFDLAEKYLKEYDDVERYLLCLERTYYFFKDRNDADSAIYISRALNEAGKTYLNFQDKKYAYRMQSLLRGMSKNESDYSSITAKYLEELLNGKSGASVIKEAALELKSYSENEGDKRKMFLPYLLEDLGDEYLRIKDTGNAVTVYSGILKDFPEYKRIIYINYKYAQLTSRVLQENLSPSYIRVLVSDNAYLQIDAAKNIINLFEVEKNLNIRINAITRMLEKYNNTQSLPELLWYISGRAYLKKGDPANAKSSLMQGLKLSKKDTYIFYKINTQLGLIAESEKKYSDMERFLADGANKYERKYKEAEYGNILHKLIAYYEEYGWRAESAGDYKKAAELYRSYVYLLLYLHTKNLYADIYNKYSPRAYVLYIDSYAEWKENDYNELSKLEYEFNEKDNRIGRARIGLDKAHIYGLAYIYAKKAAVARESGSGGIFKEELSTVLSDFSKGVNQAGWALFIDDNFIDCELLKGWIYQNVDLLRQAYEDKNSDVFDKYFPDRLLEKNVALYEKAILVNNERDYPEREGNLHLNLANTYFLLSNYPRAFVHYKEAEKYKKNFGSKIEEALFYYHLGYCYWQNDEIEKAKSEMSKTLFIYHMLSSGDYEKYKYQIYYLYRFFALFDRMEKKYDTAIQSFSRIIEFSDKYHISIDRARYIQETAYCYKELGDYKTALMHLDKAGELLNGYPDFKKDYNLKISVLGLFRIGVWDLGEDSLIIGGSKIYTELDTAEKKILNASLEEEIFSERGDYKNSIKASLKKLNLVQNRKEEKYRETHIRTLNSLGFSYCMIKDYAKAGDYFNQAIKAASNSSDNHTEGLFVSVLNKVNLYSLLMENEPGRIEDPLKTIDSFIAQIDDFRKSYKDKKFKEELKKLRKSAKAQRKDVSPNELIELEIRIAKEADEKYYRMDIATAELEFIEAELFRAGKDTKPESIKNFPAKSYEIYNYNINIYNLYSASAGRFESAIARAEKERSKRLLVKLLLNYGKCKERTGEFINSYNTYLSALKYTSALEYKELLWIVNSRIADFLAENGLSVQSAIEEEYLSAAQKYYENAIVIVEETPYLFKTESNKIKSLYDNYAKLLVHQKNFERALEISERGYATLRVLSTALSYPEFHVKADEADFREYIIHLKGIEAAGKIISSLLEAGDADKKILSAAKNNLRDRTSLFNNFIGDLKKEKPLFASYISLPKDALPNINNSVVYKFADFGNGMVAWKIDADRIYFKELAGKNTKVSSFEAVNNFIKDDNAGKFRFIVLNDTALNFFKSYQNTKLQFPLFMFIPSIERAGYYTSANNISIDRSSVIIDEKAAPSAFFQKRLEPGLLIAKPEQNNAYFINQIAEASLYSGVKTLFVSGDIIPRNMTDLIASAGQESLEAIAQKNNNIFGIGFRGYTGDEREKIKHDFKSKEFIAFQNSLKKMNFEIAELHLNKWHEIDSLGTSSVGTSSVGINSVGINSALKDDGKYFLYMSEIEYFRGNYNASLSYVNKAITAASNMSGVAAEAVSNKILLLLFTGDFQSAEIVLKEMSPGSVLISSADYRIYKSILDLVNSGSIPSVAEYNEIISKEFILPGNKLKILFAEFLYLYGSDLVNTVLEGWEGNYNIGERDALKAAILSNTAERTLSQRAQEILSPYSYKGKKEFLQKDISLELGKYDDTYHIYVFPLFFAIKSLIKNSRSNIAAEIISRIDISNIMQKTAWLDVLPFFATALDVYEAENRYNDALKIVNVINNVLKEHSISNLLKIYKYKESILLSRLGRNNESFTAALSGLSLVKNTEELYIKYQLQLANEGLYLGKIEDAKARISLIENNPEAGKNNQYAVNLLKARINLLNILKKNKASEAEWKKVESLILTALKILDNQPPAVLLNSNISLINDSLDFLITYRMSRKDLEGSLLFAEIKKLINIREKYHKLISSFAKRPAEDIIEKYKNIKDRSDSKELIDCINANPAILVNAFPSVLPLEAFRQKLDNNSIVLYFVANADDILGWAISKDSLNAVKLTGADTKIKNIIKKYNDNILSLKNTAGISRDLALLFKPFEKFYINKSNIIFVTDKYLEQIPFEIIGEKDMLEETHNIAYLASIFSSIITYRQNESTVHFVKQNASRMVDQLEYVAAKESGIPVSDLPNKTAGICHINSDILFDSFNMRLIIDNDFYQEVVKKSGLVYVPEYKLNMGSGDFAFINAVLGIKDLIINKAAIQDLNNAFFIDILYNKIYAGEKLLNSFSFAKEALRRNKEYSYPAYWTGIRMFMNGM